MPTSTTENQNGILHPHSSKTRIESVSLAAKLFRVIKIMPSDKRKPSVAVVCIQLV